MKQKQIPPKYHRWVQGLIAEKDFRDLTFWRFFRWRELLGKDK